jgi:pimeloyl-ACP methyl ester carboxylesterase
MTIVGSARRLVLVVAFLVLAAPLAMARAQTPVTGIGWTPCASLLPEMATPVSLPAALECASILVPLDYADPSGDQIAIGFNRLPARDPARRIGSLVINPGGPGGSASELVIGEALGAPIFSDAIRDHFDLIGLDPRGVGISSPVRCDPDIYNQTVSRFPGDQAGFAALVAYNTALGESCLAMTGPLLGHIDTVSAARDIEAVRLALGGEPLNFLGISYGSLLGAQYAALYPEKIRVMALDGALEHSLSEITLFADETAAYERGLDRFFAWCDADPACALHGEDVSALFDRLVARADREPIPAPACASGAASRPCLPSVTGEDIRIGAQELLLFKDAIPRLGVPGWNALAEALQAADAGDASSLSRPIASGPVDNTLFSGLAIACLDYPTASNDFADLAARERLGRVVAPHVRGAGQSWTILTGCIGWSVPVANPPHALNVQGAPPILIVNSTYDPSTGYPWALGLQAQIAGSVLLTRDGDGHTSALLPGETRDAIDHYLLTGETPPPNTVYAT